VTGYISYSEELGHGCKVCLSDDDIVREALHPWLYSIHEDLMVLSY